MRIWEKDGEFVASCPELDVYTYGADRAQAQSRLRKVILFYAETASQMGYKIDSRELLSSLEMPAAWRAENYIN